MDNMASSARPSIAKLVNHLTTLGTDKARLSVAPAADPADAIKYYAGIFRATRSWAICARLAVRLIAALALFLLVHHPLAQAGSATATLAVRATVVRSCGVSTNAGGTTESGGSASLRVNCAPGSGKMIAINGGNNASGGMDLRSLSEGNGTISYPIHNISISTDQDAVTLTVNF